MSSSSSSTRCRMARSVAGRMARSIRMSAEKFAICPARTRARTTAASSVMERNSPRRQPRYRHSASTPAITRSIITDMLKKGYLLSMGKPVSFYGKNFQAEVAPITRTEPSSPI